MATSWESKVAFQMRSVGDCEYDEGDAVFFVAPNMFSGHVRKRRPRADEWLAVVKERGQSVRSFERLSFRAQPHGPFTTIYLQPLRKVLPKDDDLGDDGDGLGDDGGGALVPHELVEWVSVFFGPALEVEVGTEATLADALSCVDLELRGGDDFGVQACSGRVREWAEKSRRGSRSRSRKELVTVVVTDVDLYPPSGNAFVFGDADVVNGSSAFSLARTRVGRRALKVLTHEICHLLGLLHCTLFECLMNGSNHGEELDGKPLFLCPICLRKLTSPTSLNVSPRSRYAAMLSVLDQFGPDFDSDCQWLLDRVG